MSFKLLTFIFSRIKELSTQYRENMQLVLKDVTVNVEHGEKVM
jgi:ABC-type transport system involved in cytochrome bd biosynthesis fused ATPase/permease subunit